MTTALEGGEGSASRTGRSLSPGKTRYPLYRRLGGRQGRFGQVQKISLPQEFDARTVQPVASHYTDYATQPTQQPIPVTKSMYSVTVLARSLGHYLDMFKCYAAFTFPNLFVQPL